MLPVPAGASVDRTSALHAYARARLADGEGASGLALQSYRRALAEDPDSLNIARRSYSQGLISGDMALALRSALLLEREGVLPRDGTLLFLCDAVKRKDWAAARQWVTRLTKEGNFGFLVPIINSWIVMAEGRSEPPQIDAADRFASLGQRYVDEHVALQALGRGDLKQALPAINRALSLRTVDVAELRLTLAAQLAGRGAREEALALLPQNAADYAQARVDLTKGKKPGGAGRPLSPRQGVGRLLARLAMDISADASTRILAVRLARMADFINPEGADSHIALAPLLTATGYPQYAVAEARKVAANSWYGALAQAELVDALEKAGDKPAAIALAQSLAVVPSAEAERFVRLGRLLAGAKRFVEAADAFRSAQARYPADGVPWALLLFQGSALEQAGRWDEARAVLEQAARIAPEEAVVLNYLGYAQIERRQNVQAALELLKKASALKPDDSSITDSLGWAKFVTGDIESAVPILERAAAGAPSDVTINEHLGDALWAVGRRYEARYAWRAAAVFANGEVAARLDAKNRHGMTDEHAAP